MSSAITPAIAARIAITRSQSRVYLHAPRHDPLTQSPASGTIASMQTT